MWLCPSCNEKLEKQGSGLGCVNGHRFDVAKEGYVNLLLAQHKNSKSPGDSKAMINARRLFLEAGHYQPLVDKLAEILLAKVDNTTFSLLDAGCGEGYYLSQLISLAGSRGIELVGCGVDISKPGIQKAAKKYPEQAFAVASTFALPLPSESQNAVLQVFAPSSSEEVYRVLRDLGLWLQVNPAEGHLREIQALLYDQVKPHTVSKDIPAGFELISSETLSFAISLKTPESRTALLMMTPYYWSASEEMKVKVAESLNSVTTDFQIRLFRKTQA